jgi:hypothetical protein
MAVHVLSPDKDPVPHGTDVLEYFTLPTIPAIARFCG